MDLVKRTRPSRADEAVSALTTIMRDAEQHRELLLAYVLGGRFRFVNALHRELRGLAVDDGMIQDVWQWIYARRGPDPKGEYEALCEARYQRQLQKDAEQLALGRLHDNARRRQN